MANPSLNDSNQNMKLEQIKDLKTASRLANNVIALLSEGSFAGKHAGPILEAMGWLDSMRTELDKQIATLEPKQPEVIQAEIVE